jgi:hypothetical protein
MINCDGPTLIKLYYTASSVLARQPDHLSSSSAACVATGLGAISRTVFSAVFDSLILIENAIKQIRTEKNQK